MTETDPIVKPRQSIFEKAAGLEIVRGWPQTSKSITTQVLNSNADPTWIHSSKDTLKCRELKMLTNWDGTITTFLQSRCIVFPLRRGFWLIPKDFFDEVEARLVAHVNGMQPLIDAFIARYDDIVRECMRSLNDQANPGDYLSKEQVRGRFVFKWKYVDYGVSGLIRSINKDIAKREADKIRAESIEAAEAIRVMMRKNFQELVDHLFQSLTPDESGKRKTIKIGTFDPLSDFIYTFPAKNNVAEDEQLLALVNQAKALAAGVAPEAVRTNEELSAKLREGFTKLKAEVDTLVVEAPSRKLILD